MDRIERLQLIRYKLVKLALIHDTPRKHYWLARINKIIARLYEAEQTENGGV